jgi:uncharacterized membrane protein YeaQ/YmgE (transglycosylase-associated protein family)
MSRYLWYTLAFIIIGLFTGHISKTDMPGGSSTTYRTHYLLGVVGALAAGLIWLLLLDYGWHGGPVQAGQGPEGTALPGYWIGLIFAPVGALLALAVHRLISRRSTNI